MPWLAYALISALSAAATAVLAKRGVEGVASTLATALRTVIVLLFAWVTVFQARESRLLRRSRDDRWIYLALSGLATGVSWLAYFRALQLGPASRVAPVEKLSLPLTIVLAALFLSETVSWKVWVGVCLMTAGALLTIA